MSKKQICPLFSAADREQAQPILDALRQKGFSLSEKSGAVLLFLSKAFAADEDAQRRFFAADSAGREIVPIDLDGAAQPELVHSALIAKNAVAAAGRSAGEIAERVSTAPIFQQSRPRRLSRTLLILALLLALGAALWLWRGAPQRREQRERAAILSAAQAKYGLSEEDLAGIAYVYIVSDGFYPLREDESERTYTIFPNYQMENDGMHWTSHADGSRIYASSWAAGDWDVLRLMPNLEGIVIVLADDGVLPDLSGLEHLEWIQIIDSRITDIGGLGGSSLSYFANFRCPIGDYSPLTRCERLEEFVMEFDFLEKADLSGFSPPALRYVRLGYAPAALELDLSGLKNCRTLEEVKLDNIPCGPPDGERSPVTDLDFLAGLPRLKTLTLESMTFLRDVSALETLPALEELTLKDCGRVTDISPLASASALRHLEIEECRAIRDFSPLGECRALQGLWLHSYTDEPLDNAFLASLPELREIHLFAERMRDVDFLNARSGGELRVTVCGDVDDYSGLAGPGEYVYLSIGPNGPVLDRALPYLRETAAIEELSLTGLEAADWALIPRPSRRLWLHDSDLTDLGGMPAWEAKGLELELTDLRRLRSLSGIEAMRALGDGGLRLEIRNCPLLYDLSALEGASLDELTISGALAAPELSGLRVGRLRLENIAGLTDLGCLDGLDASGSVDFELLGLDALRDLTPLRRFRGESLAVPPHLAEQAQELVDSGNFQSYEIAYPEGGWVFSADEEIALISLEELDTLPRVLLEHVRELCLVGERVVDGESFELVEREGRLLLRERGSGEETEITPAGGLTDLTALAPLAELRRLSLQSQPLEDLEGIQHLGALERLELRGCGDLADVSAAFTLQKLRALELSGCPLRSIEGVQNLTELEELDLSYTEVDDLRPLLELPALRRVRLSADMSAALDSLDGAAYDFELIVDQGGANE